MATFTYKGIDQYSKILSELGDRAEGICKYAVYDAAGLAAEAIKAECPVDSGDLSESIGISRFRNDNGYINVRIGFDGYDAKGVPNALKARTISKGRSNMTANPFVKRAMTRVRKQLENTIKLKLDERIFAITNKLD